MLDNLTKKNIDDCRDVLVGKVPDPKSQIEQITLALIFKFMDDMDREAVEKFKGKAKFFTGDFAKFGWRKLFDPSLSGIEIQELYSEALEKLQTNPNIPEFFRNIFKNAYLPYKDPATLKMFLKHINEFEYSHSEKLGDAFEYLLSVMGSQGDAGQFRTPRHIIDFIAACLDPKKNETVADPACGTAGFLLSAYKHILKQNTDKRLGDKLTPDQRKKLAENFVGYDISPDMVRLSLVNMYLHGFTSPQIFEYDTLSSEDKWDDTFDVILANPPFMTPKGGIRPHKRFGVQANKAEVLFTDYIAEHLNKNGRAGIIVPNGIVATTQTAYKQLRKLLVSDSLIAVVSLPAGCFQPYSGVKTSILILDKGLVRKSSNILFIKIANDGYDLGAQRREYDKNDLPLALDAFNAYKESIVSGNLFDIEKFNNICALVEKEKVLSNRDFDLNGDRYTHINKLESTFSLVQLKDVCEVTSSKRIYQEEYVKDGIPFYRTKEVSELDKGKSISLELYISKERYEEIKKSFSVPQKNDILISAVGTLGVTWVVPDDREFYFKDGNLIWLKSIMGVIPNYLKHILEAYFRENVTDISGGAAYSALTIVKLKEIEIPLPPIEIQEKIVKEIESYQKIIDGAKMVVDNYKQTIGFKPEWEMVELGSVCEIKRGRFSHRPRNDPRFFNGKYPFIQTGDVVKANCKKVSYTQTLNEEGLTVSKLFEPTIVLITIAANIGDIAILDYEACFTDSVVGLRCLDLKRLNPYYLALIMQTKKEHLNQVAPQVAQKNITVEILKELVIEVPPIEEQNEIVKQIEAEQQLVSANKQLITIFEQKIKDKIKEVWGVNETVEL